MSVESVLTTELKGAVLHSKWKEECWEVSMVTSSCFVIFFFSLIFLQTECASSVSCK